MHWFYGQGQVGGRRDCGVAQCIAASIELQHRPGADERVLGRPRGVDLRPCQSPEVELILHARNVCVGVGCIAGARADAGDAGVEVGRQEKALKFGISAAFSMAARSPGNAKTAIDDGRMPGGGDAPGLFEQACIDFGGCIGA